MANNADIHKIKQHLSDTPRAMRAHLGVSKVMPNFASQLTTSVLVMSCQVKKNIKIRENPRLARLPIQSLYFFLETCTTNWSLAKCRTNLGMINQKSFVPISKCYADAELHCNSRPFLIKSSLINN